MKIIDNFLFRNEFDLLEIRLSTHYDYVDQFVIVEGSHTFTRKYKGYNLLEQKDRYAQWWDKVKLIQLGEPPPMNTPMEVEHWSRNHFQTQWIDMSKDDVVVISDLDEILRPEALKFIRETDYDFYRLGMPFFNFKFNYLNTKGHTPWPSAKAFRGYFVEGMDGMRNVHSVPSGRQIELNHSGWHFSYLGDREWILEKMRSYSHPEDLTPEVEQNLHIETLISQGKDFGSRPGFEFCQVKLDNYFPRAITDNLSKYTDYILSDTDKSVLDYLPGNIPNILQGINNF